MTHWQTMWNFHTKRFSVSWQIAEDYDLDLSWDEDGSVRKNLESGLYQAFMSRVVVLLDGNEIGADYLSGNIYENPADFRRDPYFTDMVRVAICEARKRLSNVPHIRHA